jgi:hypothetical protein
MTKKENNRAKVKNFHKRWNTEYDERKRVEDFKNRVHTTVNLHILPIFRYEENRHLLIDYFKFIGEYIDMEMLYHSNFVGETKYIGYDVFKETIEERFRYATLVDIIYYLQGLFYLDINQRDKDKLYDDIKKDIDQSLLNIQVKKVSNGNYILYPAGAKLLDEGVVNDVLDWLSDYPDSYNNFKDALEQYENHKYTRNIVDNLRYSLESLLKKILKNRKTLEKQKKPLGKYLKDKDVSKEIRDMFSQYLAYYTLYQNEHAKHNDTVVNKLEIEFMIYLTGTFMRFILSLEANPAKS